MEAYLGLHPADLADRLQRLPTAEARAVLGQLPRPLAAGALAELEKEKIVELLQDQSPEQIAELFRELPSEVIADVAGALKPKARLAALNLLPAAQAEAAARLLQYRPDSAGGIMSDRFISLGENQSAEEALQLLRARVEPKTDEISYLYVVDEQRRLTGVVPLRDLVFAKPDRLVKNLMLRRVKSLPAEADQEAIAREFEHYHFLALPVVDAQNRLVGIVKASDAMEIARAEATEDMQLMVGLSGEERALTPWRKSIGKRLPWLYVNLATAFLAAAVVAVFESTIARWTALAIFLPIIAGQGGNAGMQTLTVIIRDMALGELTPGDGRKALLKEAILGLINGLAIGLVVGVIGWLWQGSLALGLVACGAMLLNQVAAALAGVLIPYGLKLARVDPALASSIFVTTVTDVAGFFFFLGLAALAMRWAPV